MISPEKILKLLTSASNAAANVTHDDFWQEPFRREWTPAVAVEILNELRRLQQLNRDLVILYSPLAERDRQHALQALKEGDVVTLEELRDRLLERWRPSDDDELAEEYDRQIEIKAKLVGHSFALGLAGALSSAWDKLPLKARDTGSGFDMRCWLGAAEKRGLLK